MMLRWNFRTIAKNWIAFKPVNVLKSYLTYLNGVSKTTYLNGVSQTIKNEAKEQKRRFRTMLLGTLSASLLDSKLTCLNEVQLELMRTLLEQVRIFNVALSFNNF